MTRDQKACEWCGNPTINPRFCCRSCFFKWGNANGAIGFKKGHKINSDGKNAMLRPEVRKKQYERSNSPAVKVARMNTHKETMEQNLQKHGMKVPKLSARLKADHAAGIRTMPSTKGMKISEDHKKRLWGGWKTHHTKPEMAVLNAYHGLVYVGDGSKWLTFKDGTHKNPDIVFMGYDIAIEVYGDYWHRDDNPDALVAEYNKIGWKCLVIWEHDVYLLENAGSLGDEIDRFINQDIYEPCVSPHDADYGVNESLYSDELKEGFI